VKSELVTLCRKVIEGRIRSAEEVIHAAQASANEESKSSAGDKYETGRAMAQLEIEKASSQLAEARKLLQTLEQIPIKSSDDVIRLGSLVYTNRGNYFLSIPAGELICKGVTYFALSPASPLGSALLGKTPGARIQFNQREMVINEVE
jgi:transcription elongation GreA/GreB family factor